MKILLAHNFYDPNLLGGAERSVKLLAESLVAAGDDVVVISLAVEPDQTRAVINGVTVYYVASGNIGASMADPSRTAIDRVLWHLSGEHLGRSTAAIAEILDAEKPDVIHTFCLAGMSYNIWRLANRRHIPLVHTLYDYYLICARGTMFKKGRNCTSLCMSCRLMTTRRRQQTRRVDAVVGASQYLVDTHSAQGCFPDAPISRVIYDGTPLPDVSTLRASVDTGIVRFGFLGRLHITKGVEVLLEGVSAMKSDNWSLSIAGRGAEGYEPALREKYSDPRIRFLGWSSADEFLRQIDVLVVPSIWNEPLGRITMEAYSYGLPVIAARRGGIPEVIEEEKTGWLFEPDDIAGFANLLDRITREPRALQEAREACLAKAHREFRQEYSASCYRKLYEELSEFS